MKSKSITVLLSLSALFVALISGILAWTALSGGKEQTADTSTAQPVPEANSVHRDNLLHPPPAPKAVAKPDRVRQNLRAGKTLVTHTKGVLHVRGEDKDWGIKEVITIIFAFEAQIDRAIESNDGTTIVELRHFRDVRCVKLETKLEDVRIELGHAPNLLLGVLAIADPKMAIGAAAVVQRIEGASFKQLIQGLRLAGISPDKLIEQDPYVKAFGQVDRLTGKKVRLTYVDGKGVTKLEAVQGELTPAERDFHFASVLVSDSLIVPDVDIKIGNRWSVDGSNFGGMFDPTLLARTAGEVTLERAPDHIVQGKTCRHMKVVGGRILLNDASDPKVGDIGYFEPQGSAFFSPDDQIVIEAKLRGRAQIDRFSKDHLLFEARLRRQPEIDLSYTCRIVDTLKK